MADLNVKINRSVVLKAYNQSNIEQLSQYLVKLRHNDKCVKCRLFVVPVDAPVLLGMPDIELIGIIRVMCETIDNNKSDRKFDMQTRHASDSQNCKANRDPQTKPDADNASGNKTNILDYLNFCTNKIHIIDFFHTSNNKKADRSE